MLHHSLPGQPFKADIVGVHSDRCVNLGITAADGEYFKRTSVTLKQEGDVLPAETGFAEWMPYQIGQAAKTEQAEADSCKCNIGGDAVNNEFDLPQICTAVFFTGSNITVNIQQ